MKTLRVDEKWSVTYDPDNNDRPHELLRHGEVAMNAMHHWNNPVMSMFYALLERDEQIKKLGDMIHERGNSIAILKAQLKEKTT